MNIYESAADLVGKTPLLKLNRIAEKFKLKANIIAKCEFFNPSFSVKDRPAKAMIEEAENNGAGKENIFIEATSGNMGIALASICAAKGYKLVIVMPENMPKERIRIMQRFGANVILTPAQEGMKGAIIKSELLAHKNPQAVLLRQFENVANINSHKFGTSIEILEDTNGDVDCFVAGVGTSGTISGVASALKTYNPELYVVAVEPSKSPVLSGGEKGSHRITGIGAGFVPKFYDKSLINEVIKIEDEEAFEMSKTVAETEGLSIGISAGAAVCAAVNLAKRNEMQGKNIVVILPDSAERYFSVDGFK